MKRIDKISLQNNQSLIVSKINGNCLIVHDYALKNEKKILAKFKKIGMFDEIPVKHSIDSFKAIYISIHSSSKCNLNCRYCFNRKKGNDKINFEDCVKFIDMITARFPNADKFFDPEYYKASYSKTPSEVTNAIIPCKKIYSLPTKYQLLENTSDSPSDGFTPINSFEHISTAKVMSGPIETITFRNFVVNIPTYELKIPSDAVLMIDKGEIVNKGSQIYVRQGQPFLAPSKLRLIEITKAEEITLLFEDIDGIAVKFPMTFRQNYSFKNLLFYYYNYQHEQIFLNIDKIDYDKSNYEYIFTLTIFFVNEYVFNNEIVTIYIKYQVENDELYIKEEFLYFDSQTDQYYVNVLLHSPERGYGYIKEYVEPIKQFGNNIIIRGKIAPNNVVIKLY